MSPCKRCFKRQAILVRSSDESPRFKLARADRGLLSMLFMDCSCTFAQVREADRATQRCLWSEDREQLAHCSHGDAWHGTVPPSVKRWWAHVHGHQKVWSIPPVKRARKKVGCSRRCFLFVHVSGLQFNKNTGGSTRFDVFTFWSYAENFV